MKNALHETAASEAAARSLGEFDIPDRVSTYLSVPVTQVVVALACTVMSFAARAGVDALFIGAGPFALTFPFVLFATLFARWQAGALTMTLCALYAWYFVLPIHGSFEFQVPSDGPRVLVNLISGFAIVGLAESFRRTVRRAVTERDDRVRERQLYLREFDHRVKNNFAMVSSLVRMEARRAGSDEARSSLETIHGRVESISRAHEALYRGEDGVMEVSMRPYLNGLCSSLEQALFDNGETHIMVDIDNVALPRDRAVSLGLLVNELVTNAAKHAFRDGGHGVVVVRLERDGTDARLTVEDDGVGMTGEPQRDGGLGQQLIAAFAEQAGGALRTESPAKGSRFIFDFALEN